MYEKLKPQVPDYVLFNVNAFIDWFSNMTNWPVIQGPMLMHSCIICGCAIVADWTIIVRHGWYHAGEYFDLDS